jgi:hypothetical protein
MFGALGTDQAADAGMIRAVASKQQVAVPRGVLARTAHSTGASAIAAIVHGHGRCW